MDALIVYDLVGQPYHYRPLREDDEVRLLRIIRGSHQPWTYELEHHILSEAPPYNTLSYVWGQSSRAQLLALQDGSSLRMNRNLAEAIPFLSPICTTGYLWVDQLCIDQENTAERNHQVRQMKQIYSRSERGLIWLGTELYQNAGFQRCVEAAKDIYPKQLVHGTSQGYEDEYLKLSGRFAALENEEQERIRSSLLRNPWFRRTWVLQEFILPIDVVVVLGTTQLSMASVFALNVVINKHRDTECLSFFPLDNERLSSHIRFMMTLRNRRFDTSWQGRGFDSNLLTLSPQTICSDRRDHVYGILGISDFGNRDIKPDYDADVSTVFAAATFWVISDRGDLYILDQFHDTEHHYTPAESLLDNIEELHLPSWVPDFRKPIVALGHLGRVGLPIVHRDLLKRSPMAKMTDGVLRLRGKVIDTVVAARKFSFRKSTLPRRAGFLYPHIYSVNECHHIMDACGITTWVRTTFENCFQEHVATPSEQELLFICLHYVCDLHGNGPSDGSCECLKLCRQYFEATTRSTSRSAETPKIEGEASEHMVSKDGTASWFDVDISFNIDLNSSRDPYYIEAPKTSSRVQTDWKMYPVNLSSRSLVVTAQGHIGFASNPEEGDVVAILHGSQYPMLLRPRPNCVNHYSLVQRANVWIANGEYNDFWEEKDADSIYLV